MNFVGNDVNMEGSGTIRFNPIERGGFDSVMVYTAIFENWDSFKTMIANIPPNERVRQHAEYTEQFEEASELLKVIYMPDTTKDDFTEEWNFLDNDLLSQVMEPFIREGLEFHQIVIPSEQAVQPCEEAPRTFKPIGDRPILAVC